MCHRNPIKVVNHWLRSMPPKAGGSTLSQGPSPRRAGPHLLHVKGMWGSFGPAAGTKLGPQRLLRVASAAFMPADISATGRRPTFGPGPFPDGKLGASRRKTSEVTSVLWNYPFKKEHLRLQPPFRKPSPSPSPPTLNFPARRHSFLSIQDLDSPPSLSSQISKMGGKSARNPPLQPAES